ncbi:hypothetical protein GCM10028816_21380 [Spirosoma lituiforme]
MSMYLPVYGLFGSSPGCTVVPPWAVSLLAIYTFVNVSVVRVLTNHSYGSIRLTLPEKVGRKDTAHGDTTTIHKP